MSPSPATRSTSCAAGGTCSLYSYAPGGVQGDQADQSQWMGPAGSCPSSEPKRFTGSSKVRHCCEVKRGGMIPSTHRMDTSDRAQANHQKGYNAYWPLCCQGLQRFDG